MHISAGKQMKYSQPRTSAAIEKLNILIGLTRSVFDKLGPTVFGTRKGLDRLERDGRRVCVEALDQVEPSHV